MKKLLFVLVFLLIGCSSEPLEVQLNTHHPSAFGRSDGRVTLDISGGKSPYVITVNEKEVTNSIEGLSAGDYTILVKDRKGDRYESHLLLIDPLDCQYEVKHVKEAFQSTGEIILNPMGGLPPYQIIHKEESVEMHLKDLPSDDYTFLITDTNHQEMTVTIHVEEPKTSTIVDQEGHIYPVVKINDQWWMASNLKVTKDLDGQAIDYFKYKEDNTLSKKYGYLYTYDTAMKALIEGWRLPTDDEFKSLESYLGMNEEDLKKVGSSERGRDISYKLLPGGETGFNAELSGFYAPEHGYNGMKIGVAYMTSTSYNSDTLKDHVIVRTIMKDDGRIYSYPDPKNWGFYVRLIKD